MAVHVLSEVSTAYCNPITEIAVNTKPIYEGRVPELFSGMSRGLYLKDTLGDDYVDSPLREVRDVRSGLFCWPQSDLGVQ